METTRILLVDDDPALLKALPTTISLRMIGVEVQTTAEASMALNLLQEQDYDVIISDILMPGMDGLELLDIVTERHPETPVLLITGHSKQEMAIQALRGGAYDYILKPIQRDAFLASLERALHTRQLRRQIGIQQRALEQYALSMEREVAQRTRELKTTSAAKDSLLNTVAQELAPPLTKLEDMALLAEQQLQQPNSLEKVRGTVANMEHSISYLKQLVLDLQETDHIQSLQVVLHPSRSDIVELCYKVLKKFTSTYGVVPGFEVEICEEPMEANVDSEHLAQALLHLLTNAYFYSPKGTPINVQVQRTSEDVIIAVQDHGVGIRDEYLSHITEQFYRVPDIEMQNGTSRGWGLGLYLARTIIEQHNGHLEIQSEVGEGSTFSIVLPLSESTV